MLSAFIVLSILLVLTVLVVIRSANRLSALHEENQRLKEKAESSQKDAQSAEGKLATANARAKDWRTSTINYVSGRLSQIIETDLQGANLNSSVQDHLGIGSGIFMEVMVKGWRLGALIADDRGIRGFIGPNLETPMTMRTPLVDGHGYIDHRKLEIAFITVRSDLRSAYDRFKKATEAA